jgi:peptidoglycan/LPS O-acetylase OafA/YrhL
MKHLPAIDGLRAIAVLAVVAYHAGLPVPAGFVGVDVFFVISGYLITRLLHDEVQATGRIDFLAFYARRARRIFPAAAVVVLVVLAASYLMLPPTERAHTANSAGAALVFGANVFFQFTTGGYWDADASEMPLLHLWSLSVEEQFYFLWPALLMLLPRRRLRPVLVGLAVASLILAEVWIAQGSDAAFYQMPTRFWELAIGGLIALTPGRSRGLYAYSGLLILTVAVMLPLPTFPGTGAIPAVLGAALILHAVQGGLAVPLLELRPMRYVGLISYSLYLWHWPLLALDRATRIGEAPVGVRLALCGAAFVLAIVSYRVVEQPFRRLRFRSGRTVAFAVSVSAALALSACAFGLQAQRSEPEMPSLSCHSTDSDPATPKCERGAARVGIWGDSMAYAWTPLALQMDPHAVGFTRNACAPTGDSVSHTDHDCAAFARLATERAQGLDTLILAARWWVYPHADLAATLAAVSSVRRVVILGPTPELHDGAPRCIYRHAETQCAISRAAFDAEAGPILAKLRRAAAGHPNVEVVDMTDQFCTAAACPPVLDGVPLYWDSHHISPSAARRSGGIPEHAAADQPIVDSRLGR